MTAIASHAIFYAATLAERVHAASTGRIMGDRQMISVDKFHSGLDRSHRFAVLCGPVHHCDAVLGRTRTAVRARRGKKLATRVTVSVDERDYEQLSTLAEEHRVSLAWLVRYAVADFLQRYRQDQLQLPLELTSRRR